MKTMLEIHAAEGGQDSQLFIRDLAQSYLKLAQRLGWIARVVLEVSGKIRIEFDGDDLAQLTNESGSHRIQRVPPTERNGRVHTSIVSVAVMEQGSHKVEHSISDNDFNIEWYSGTGAGGQHRNKHQNSARITHLPTGLVETAQCRSRENSYNEAMNRLVKRLQADAAHQTYSLRSADKKAQIGSGDRGSYIRTYCFQHGVVKDRRSGRQITIKQFNQGALELLW